jgi:hypothetical protein
MSLLSLFSFHCILPLHHYLHRYHLLRRYPLYLLMYHLIPSFGSKFQYSFRPLGENRFELTEDQILGFAFQAFHSPTIHW